MERLTIAMAGALLFIAAATATLMADTLVMRDGRRIQGELRSVRDGVIEFAEQRSGSTSTRTLRVNRDEVARIELDEDTWGYGALPEGQTTRPSGLLPPRVSGS